MKPFLAFGALAASLLLVHGELNTERASQLAGAGPARNSYILSRAKRQLPGKVTEELPHTNIDGGPNVVDQNFNNLRGKGETRYSTDMRRLVYEFTSNIF